MGPLKKSRMTLSFFELLEAFGRIVEKAFEVDIGMRCKKHVAELVLSIGGPQRDDMSMPNRVQCLHVHDEMDSIDAILS